MDSRLPLSNTAFNALLPRLGRLSKASVEIAREVLVEGRIVSEIAIARGLTRQRVHCILRRFSAAQHEAPAHWQKIEVWVPPELGPEIREIAANARARHHASLAPCKAEEE